MKCIFCMQEKPAEDMTEEHVFPEAIGGTLSINCVCKLCNDYLGHSIDNHLCDHLLVQFERLLRKIPGKSGRIPNPLERGVLADGSGNRTVYKINNQGKPEGIYLVPRVSQAPTPEGNIEVHINVDAKDRDQIPKILKKIAARSDRKIPENISQFFEEQLIERPIVHCNSQIDLSSYRRSILTQPTGRT